MNLYCFGFSDENNNDQLNQRKLYESVLNELNEPFGFDNAIDTAMSNSYL